MSSRLDRLDWIGLGSFTWEVDWGWRSRESLIPGLCIRALRTWL